MITVGQDPEALLAPVFLPYDVKADATRFLLGTLDREGEFHFFLVGGDALRVVTLSLVDVERIETEFSAQFTELTVGVSASLVAAEATLHQERTEADGVVDGNPFFHAIGVDNIGVRLERLAGVEFFLKRRHKDGCLRVQAV